MQPKRTIFIPIFINKEPRNLESSTQQVLNHINYKPQPHKPNARFQLQNLNPQKKWEKNENEIKKNNPGKNIAP